MSVLVTFPGSRDEPLRIVLDGTLDIEATWHIVQTVRDYGWQFVTEIDFCKAAQVHDYALAVLVHALLQVPRAGLRTVGLRQHARRLLAYLGVNAETLEFHTAEAHRGPVS